MKPTTARQKAIAKSLTALIPMAPFADAQAIREAAGKRAMRDLPASIAVWLSTIAHLRHVHTEYDALLDEGYDRDSARFFVVDAINSVLTTWRATRLLDPDDDQS